MRSGTRLPMKGAVRSRCHTRWGWNPIKRAQAKSAIEWRCVPCSGPLPSIAIAALPGIEFHTIVDHAEFPAPKPLASRFLASSGFRVPNQRGCAEPRGARTASAVGQQPLSVITR